MAGTVDAAAIEKDEAARAGEGGTAGGARKFAAKAFVDEGAEVEATAVARAEEDSGGALTREKEQAA